MQRREADIRRKAALSKARGLLLVQDDDNGVDVLRRMALDCPGDSEVVAKLEEAVRLQAAYADEKKKEEAIAESKNCLRQGMFQRAIQILEALGPDSIRKEQVHQLLAYAREQWEQEKRAAEADSMLAEAAQATRVDPERALALVNRLLELSREMRRRSSSGPPLQPPANSKRKTRLSHG